MSIWSQLPRPFYVLAPMDDVTDTVFRQIVAGCAPPDVYFTEFANVDGLQSDGRESVMEKLRIDSPTEQPLIAQLWGLDPQHYFTTAQQIADGSLQAEMQQSYGTDNVLPFAGIDINMGCPVATVTKRGACSALIENHPLARDIIQATKEGAAGRLPVSVKTRIGYRRIETDDWCGFLLKQGLDALIVHGRTSKEMSKVPNHWEEIAKVPALRDELAPDTAIIGNGDVMQRNQGEELAKKHGLDGIMVGRGIFQDPYVFGSTPVELSKQERINLYGKHISLFAKTWGETKNPAGLKKFAKMYIREFDGASDVREELMQANSLEDLSAVIARHT